jgi:hypothetical protein
MEDQMKKFMAVCAAAIVFASAGALLAHHSLAQFDTTKGVTVKGAVVVFEQVNPHSFIFLDAKGADGQMHRWAIEGPGVPQLGRLNIGKTTLKVGDVIEACGYVPKEGVKLERRMNTEPISLSLKDKFPKSVTGQVLTGEVLTLPDGTKQRWSDYGHHKCLGSEYQDIHTK